MQQRKTILLIDDPIQISSVFDEHISDQEADLSVLETCRFLDQAEEDDG
jgi:tRNA A37 methylthiotransferase MiaB